MIHGYCIRAADDPAPRPHLSGVDGSPIRQIVSGSLAIWVSTSDGGAVTVERLRQHERVVRDALRGATPLPLRFGTRFPDDGAARAALDQRRAAFEDGLTRVAERIEMGIRVAFREPSPRTLAAPVASATPEPISGAPDDGAAALSESAAGPAGSGPDPHAGPDPSGSAVSPGRAYLEARRRTLLEEADALERAERLLQELANELSELEAPVVLSPAPHGLTVGSLAHLVHRSNVRPFRTRVAQLQQEHRELSLTVSGPWAPYSFV